VLLIFVDISEASKSHMARKLDIRLAL